MNKSMTKRQEQVVIILFIISVFVSLLEIFSSQSIDYEISNQTIKLWSLTFPTLIAIWYYNEKEEYRSSRHMHIVFTILVFILWPLFLLHHLLVNRKVEGLMIYFAFMFLVILPMYCGYLAWYFSY